VMNDRRQWHELVVGEPPRNASLPRNGGLEQATFRRTLIPRVCGIAALDANLNRAQQAHMEDPNVTT
jgi:hypothetical protein